MLYLLSITRNLARLFLQNPHNFSWFLEKLKKEYFLKSTLIFENLLKIESAESILKIPKKCF